MKADKNGRICGVMDKIDTLGCQKRSKSSQSPISTTIFSLLFLSVGMIEDKSIRKVTSKSPADIGR